jgi:4-amino-4-deoxychorismate lyase
VETLRAVSSNDVDYEYKYADRNYLKQLFARRSGADDILIIKDGMLTDSYYANVILRKGNDWITPTTCLLNGVKRQWLISQQIIREEQVSIDDIQGFSEIGLINAMLHPDEMTIPTTRILLP